MAVTPKAVCSARLYFKSREAQLTRKRRHAVAADFLLLMKSQNSLRTRKEAGRWLDGINLNLYLPPWELAALR